MSRSGAKQRDGLELIEVFAPDDAQPDGAPWTAAGVVATPVIGRQRSSRRAVALATLFAFVAVGVGAFAFDGDGSTDSAASTTLPEPPTTPRPLLAPITTPERFVIEDPSLTAYSADIVTPPSTSTEVRVYTDGTAIGPIVTFELHAYPFSSYGVVGATRDVVDGIELVRSQTYCPPSGAWVTARCEVVMTEIAIDSEWSVTLRASHLADADIVRIASGVRVIGGRLAEDGEQLERLELGLTFAADSFETLIFGQVKTAVRYTTADGAIATLRTATGVGDQRLAGFLYLVHGAQRAFFDRAYGYLANGDTIVIWEDNGTLLSLVGPGDPNRWIEISQNVRPADANEWLDMMYGLRPDYTLGDFATLATGQASNGELWSAGSQIAQRRGRAEFLWWWTVPGFDDVTASTPASFLAGRRPHFDAVVVPGATFVFVSQPGEGGTVTVRTAMGTEYAAELVKPFAQSAVWMAVIHIEEPGLVTVKINNAEIQQ